MSFRFKRPGGLAIVTTMVLVFLFAPIVVVLLNAFNGNQTLDSWGGFTGGETAFRFSGGGFAGSPARPRRQ